LVFLHFVEQRMLAAASAKVELHDEMDHYGLYLAQNNYSKFAADLMGEDIGMMNFEGYRNSIDDYFRSVLEGDPQEPPSQSAPERWREIIDFIAQADKSKRAELSSFLLDFSGEVRGSIAQAINDGLLDNERLKRPLPRSFNGPRPFTFYVWSP